VIALLGEDGPLMPSIMVTPPNYPAPASHVAKCTRGTQRAESPCAGHTLRGYTERQVTSTKCVPPPNAVGGVKPVITTHVTDSRVWAISRPDGFGEFTL